jgi:hypothetical protein
MINNSMPGSLPRKKAEAAETRAKPAMPQPMLSIAN